MQYHFPENFLWGIASCAAQTEGAAFEDGKTASCWDVFCRLPGSIRGGDVMDIACDHYHLYEQDIAKMARMGIKSYRFSFSWPRILPEGTGRVNQAGIDFYHRLIRCMKSYGIRPLANLCHWDIPYALQLKGGFGNREMIRWFGEYMDVLLNNFGDEVDLWCTFNEPIGIFVGYAKGVKAPGLRDEAYGRQALHNALVCHGEAVRRFRERNIAGAKIGIIVDVWKHYPARPDSEEDRAIADYYNECDGYGMILSPLLLGKYDEKYLTYLKDHDLSLDIREGDMELIHQPLDYFGLNYYNAFFEHADEVREREELKKKGHPQHMKMVHHPEMITEVLYMLVHKYQLRTPIIISESGIPELDPDHGPMEDFLNDDWRIDYLEKILQGVYQGLMAGLDIRGYYIWTFMDNFEWEAGFTMRYGLYYTDFETLERTPKKSAFWFHDVIENNGFERED